MIIIWLFITHRLLRKWKAARRHRRWWRSGEEVSGAGGAWQFIEVRMTVKNRWDEAAEECFVGGTWWWGWWGGETRPMSTLGAAKAPCPWMPRVSPLTGEMGLEHRVFHHQTLPGSSEEYPPPPWCTHQSEFEERNALVTIRRAHGMGPEALSAASSTLSVGLGAFLRALRLSKVDMK